MWRLAAKPQPSADPPLIRPTGPRHRSHESEERCTSGWQRHLATGQQQLGKEEEKKKKIEQSFEKNAQYFLIFILTFYLFRAAYSSLFCHSYHFLLSSGSSRNLLVWHTGSSPGPAVPLTQEESLHGCTIC